VLVALLSVPFAGLGAATELQLYPGIPVAALAFVCPVTAAAKRWLLLAAILMPAITAAAFALLHPEGAQLRVPVPSALALFPIFLVAAFGEELGWSVYALDPLQARAGALVAAVVLGVIWAGWHVIAMVQAGQTPAWIAWGCLDMVATRVLMVWIYDNTGGSVFAVALYHAMATLAVKVFFPGGSYEGERVLALLLAGAAVLVAMRGRFPRLLPAPGFTAALR
jgi:membrane protease YdiL (CAAX protease family)